MPTYFVYKNIIVYLLLSDIFLQIGRLREIDKNRKIEIILIIHSCNLHDFDWYRHLVLPGDFQFFELSASRRNFLLATHI